MFTGLVQAVGRIERRGSGLVVSGCAPFAPLQLGDSVAVDGVCLTVAALVGDGFLANVSEETLQRSTLGRKASSGGSVNLEPALRLSDRLGGHLVSGHVDSIGEVVGIEALSQSWNLELRWRDAAYGRYICEKASVACQWHQPHGGRVCRCWRAILDRRDSSHLDGHGIARSRTRG